MQNRFIIYAALLISIACPAVAQSTRGPSTEAERARALAAIDDLETNPLGANAKDERRWLTMWLIEVPDIHVSLCLGLLPDLPKGSKQDSDIVATQLMFSSASYAIKHLAEPSDPTDQYQAGVEGSLRAYEALIAARPKDRQTKLDDLVQRRAAGTLTEYVKGRAQQSCKK